MLSKKMNDALNEQINAEFYSAYLYLSMEAYFESVNLPGFAKWMRAQIQEESVHALKLYDFVNERGGRVLLKTIEGPATEWSSPLAAFKAAYAHEQKVTDLINSLVNLAVEEKDRATNSFLQWFVNEQVEEEASADAVVQQLKMVKDSAEGKFMIDRELGQRVFVPPAAEGEE
ncbi:MAG: ferritin [Sedimentisphaerales bacterium]|nr:ferritin [Sedimentisphaerales bacterium]